MYEIIISINFNRNFLSSVEILFGKINLINFFSNHSRFESNKYVSRISQFSFDKGMEKNYFSRIGIVLIGVGNIMQYYLL